MTIDEVVKLVNAHQKKALTPLQEFVLRSSWEGKTFANMANEAHYGAQRLREVAAELWRGLSEIFGEPVSKADFRQILESHSLTIAQQQLIKKYSNSVTPLPLEYPSGPVALNSPFYIERPPIEELAFAEITRPGCVIRIKGSRQTGKSSLILRIIDRAVSYRYHIANIDFQLVEEAVFADLDRFLRWFCANVSRQLHLESRIDDFWDEEIGSKVSCTIYFQGYLLELCSNALLLTLNEVNRVFEYPEIAKEFLPLLRFWHEQAQQAEIWQKLRLVVAYSTEIYIPLQLNQSPFNIGLPLNLPPFNLEQVQELERRHGLDYKNGKNAKRLMAMLGGHPYLIRLALYYLSRQEATLNQLLEEAPTAAGIYNDHLRTLLEALLAEPKLGAAFKQVVSAQQSVQLDPIVAYKLNSMGLVNLERTRVYPSCELYRLYFSQALELKE